MPTKYKYVTTTLLTITHIIAFAEFIFRVFLQTCAEAIGAHIIVLMNYFVYVSIIQML